MNSTPRIVVISDFPIVATTASAVFGGQYEVVAVSWQRFINQEALEAEIVIVDVTTVAEESALQLLSHLLPDSQVVVCSLHRNEVQVYRSGREGLVIERALPSLLDLAAA